MANQEHMERLKQGVAVWNAWRQEFPKIRSDLSDAPLSGADLSGANFIETNFSGANLDRANLSGAFLHSANLNNANLIETNLSGAHLSGVQLYEANLSGADLSGAYLEGAILSRTILSRTILNNTAMSSTTLGELDLRSVKGLETVRHYGPSHLSINTLYLSQGHIPEVFVEGTGAPDAFIEYMHSLITRPIEYYTCFISFSSKDQDFAERLYADLQSQAVRCWFAPHHMKTGDKIRNRIDESIRIYDKLLLVLSEHSVTSTWVEHEVEAALDKELLAREHHTPQTVLFPLTLDDAVMAIERSWPAKVRRERHITDFRYWKDQDVYQRAFERLLHDLKAKQTSKD